MTGRLAAIAVKSKPREPMKELLRAKVSLQAGIVGEIAVGDPVFRAVSHRAAGE